VGIVTEEDHLPIDMEVIATKINKMAHMLLITEVGTVGAVVTGMAMTGTVVQITIIQEIEGTLIIEEEEDIILLLPIITHAMVPVPVDMIAEKEIEKSLSGLLNMVTVVEI
jgi:hypothetical protein